MISAYFAGFNYTGKLNIDAPLLTDIEYLRQALEINGGLIYTPQVSNFCNQVIILPDKPSYQLISGLMTCSHADTQFMAQWITLNEEIGAVTHTIEATGRYASTNAEDDKITLNCIKLKYEVSGEFPITVDWRELTFH